MKSPTRAKDHPRTSWKIRRPESYLVDARKKTERKFRIRETWYTYLLSYFIKNRLSKTKKPLLAGMKVTNRCNLKCRHCPFWRKRRESISFSDAKKSMDKLYELGVRLLIIEGGEPFLWKDMGHDIRDIAREARKRFFNVGITTNGTFPLDIDTDIIWVSVDGLKKTHDSIRGKSFDKAVSHIRSSSHPNIFAHMTINSQNWQDIPGLVDFISTEVKGITFQFHYPYQEVDEELFLSFDKRRPVLDRLIDLKKQGLPVANSYACLRALKTNRWKCRPWMIASIDPDGKLTHGCYVKNRGKVSCEKCGFSAHVEISLAYNGVLESMLLGARIFHQRREWAGKDV